jgi:excisionase family DNA binding protein
MNSVLDSPNPRRLMSLASRINAIHRALTAEELAELLQMSRITILRRAKRGSIPSFRVGSCVRFDLSCHRQVADAAGRTKNVQKLRSHRGL